MIIKENKEASSTNEKSIIFKLKSSEKDYSNEHR